MATGKNTPDNKPDNTGDTGKNTGDTDTAAAAQSQVTKTGAPMAPEPTPPTALGSEEQRQSDLRRVELNEANESGLTELRTVDQQEQVLTSDPAEGAADDPEQAERVRLAERRAANGAEDQDAHEKAMREAQVAALKREREGHDQAGRSEDVAKVDEALKDLDANRGDDHQGRETAVSDRTEKRF